MENIAVYSVNVGGYDTYKKWELTPYVHHYYFTDDETFEAPQGINVVLVEPSPDPIRQSREIKINIHKYLPQFDYYIYIDASYSIINKLTELIKVIDPSKTTLWLKRHQKRTNIKEEGERVKVLRKAEGDVVDEQLKYYSSSGYNVLTPVLYECGMFFRANTPAINEAFEDWYSHVERFTARDQISMPFIVKKHKLIPTVFNDYTIRKYFKLHDHQQNTVMGIPALKMFAPPKKRAKVHYFTPASSDKNLGKAYNEACEMIKDKDDWICIRDGDTMFLTPDWPVQIEAIIEKHGNDFDLISCYTNRLGLRHQLLNNNFNQDPNVINHTRLAFLQRNKYWDEVVQSPNYTAGLFMLFKKSLWDEIKFAEGLTQTKNNIFVDADFSQSVLKKKKKIGLAKGIYLFHLYRIYKEDHRNYDHLR